MQKVVHNFYQIFLNIDGNPKGFNRVYMPSSIGTFSCHNFCVIKSNLYWAVTQKEYQNDYSIQVDSLKQVSPNWRIEKNHTLLPYN